MEFLLPSQTQSLWLRASPWARVQDSYTLQKKKIETGLSKTDVKIISVDLVGKPSFHSGQSYRVVNHN